MTPLEHERWMRVARSSKRGRWYVPRHPSGAEGRLLGELFRRGYFQRRRANGAFRIAGLWPRTIWPAWARPEDIDRPHSWWPPWVPFVAVDPVRAAVS